MATKTASAVSSTTVDPSNQAPVDVDGTLLDFGSWTEQQIGFAPYWNPEEGAFFVGKLLARDERDEEFVRYLVQALTDTKCGRGPKDGNGVPAETVIVKAGEQFTLSVYAGIGPSFDQYLSSKIAPPMHVSVKNKTKLASDPKKSFWNFAVKIPAQFDKQLADYRRDHGLGSGPIPKALAADAPKRELQS